MENEEGNERKKKGVITMIIVKEIITIRRRFVLRRSSVEVNGNGVVHSPKSYENVNMIISIKERG